jgi:hypothetical protein
MQNFDTQKSQTAIKVAWIKAKKSQENPVEKPQSITNFNQNYLLNESFY